jgi:hypothetical protein
MAAKRKRNPEHKYRTESSFRKALAKYTASGELVHWYGTDYGWVIVTRKVLKRAANPKGKIIKGAHVRMLANGRLNVVLPRRLNPRDSSLKEYKVVLYSRLASRNLVQPVYATTAGQASKIARSRKKEWVSDPRNWKVLSVKRVSR